MKQSENIAKLATALVAAQGQIKPVVKDRQNPHFKNNYATLDAIMESARPILAANGLAVIQGGGSPVSDVDGIVRGVSVETMLVHASGEYVSSNILMPLDKPSAQAVGSAITYGRRYGVAALLSLTTEEDDDGNVATANAHNPPTARTTSQGAVASNGAGDPAAKKMPFGKQKGKALGEIDSVSLESTIEWCSSDDEKAEKFKELIDACGAVIRARLATAGATNGLPSALRDEPDDLPF